MEGQPLSLVIGNTSNETQELKNRLVMTEQLVVFLQQKVIMLETNLAWYKQLPCPMDNCNRFMKNFTGLRKHIQLTHMNEFLTIAQAANNVQKIAETSTQGTNQTSETPQYFTL